MNETQDLISFCHAGEVKYPNDVDILERIIAGEPMPDRERQAFSISDTDISHELLRPIPDTFTGSHGFLDFRIIHNFLFIAHLGVEPQFRRRGIASGLVAAAILEAHIRQLEGVNSFIALGREEELYPILKQFGFTIKQNSLDYKCHLTF